MCCDLRLLFFNSVKLCKTVFRKWLLRMHTSHLCIMTDVSHSSCKDLFGLSPLLHGESTIEQTFPLETMKRSPRKTSL